MIMLNQPFNGQLGEILKDKMAGPYNKLTILSAFAKNSGVLRLKPTLEQFKSAGGYIEAFIGVDAHGTSYEAVLNLFELCNELCTRKVLPQLFTQKSICYPMISLKYG